VIDVQQAQDVPRAGPDLFHFVPGTPLTVTGPGVLGNDIDFEGDALTASLLQGPAHGTLELYPDGSFTYTPEPGFKGMDLFHYAVSDGEHSSSGTVYLDGTGGRPWAIVNDPALWGVWFSGVQAPEGMEIQALQAMFDQAGVAARVVYAQNLGAGSAIEAMIETDLSVKEAQLLETLRSVPGFRDLDPWGFSWPLTGYGGTIQIYREQGVWRAQLGFTFGSSGWGVTQGAVRRVGDDLFADSTMRQPLGAVLTVITYGGLDYELGALEEGDYTFTYQTYGQNVQTVHFTVPPDQHDFPPPRLPGYYEIFPIVGSEPSAPLPTISIGDGVTGPRGRRTRFTVTLSGPADELVAVDYTTADGTAIGHGRNKDYNTLAGTLTFKPGETSKTITVKVKGNKLAEPDENFFVDLLSPTNATLADARGNALIKQELPGGFQWFEFLFQNGHVNRNHL
jgi:hypothetical protein